MYFGKYYFVLSLEVDNITAIPPLMALEVRDTTEMRSVWTDCSSNRHVKFEKVMKQMLWMSI